MKTECSIVKDLLPLYVEDMLSPESASYVKSHLDSCKECRKELEVIRAGDVLLEKKESENDGTRPFKRIMKRMNRQLYILAYPIVILFVFLGFSLTGGEHLMYNSLIMPIVGIFGYLVFRWRAIYKMPILLLAIDVFAWLFGLVELDLHSTVVWTLLYSVFVLVGIAIAFLLHYAFRKENSK